MKIWQLFVSFFKIGLFTFGGGYAMLPLIQKETVEKHGWIEETDVTDIFAISQITPGVIAVNAATFIGYKVGGFLGSLFATLGVVLPSFIIICVIFLILTPFMENKWVSAALTGIKMGVILLLCISVVKLAKANKLDAFFYVMATIAFLLASFTSINVIYILIGAIIVGIFYVFIKNSSRGKNA